MKVGESEESPNQCESYGLQMSTVAPPHYKGEAQAPGSHLTSIISSILENLSDLSIPHSSLGFSVPHQPAFPGDYPGEHPIPAALCHLPVLPPSQAAGP